MKAEEDRLGEAIAPDRSVLVDTSVVLAYLGGGAETSEVARRLFDEFAAKGRNHVAVSAVTVSEILVRPFNRGPASLTLAEGFLRHFGNLRVLDITYEVAREAARIRALTEMAMPDALIAASAVVGEIDVLVTNDRSWPAQLTPVLPNVAVLPLPDLS